MNNGRFLTVKQVSEIIGWKESTVRARILRRLIPFYKLGRSVRVSQEDLAQMIETARVPAREPRNGR
jgi:excisionase family DNA binding protein